MIKNKNTKKIILKPLLTGDPIHHVIFSRQELTDGKLEQKGWEIIISILKKIAKAQHQSKHSKHQKPGYGCMHAGAIAKALGL